MARIELSADAEVDLEEIDAHSIVTFGVAVAQAYLLSFKQAFQLLSEHPRIGVLQEDIDPPIYSLPNRSHRIYYDIDGDRVIIQRILHKAMDAEKWLG